MNINDEIIVIRCTHGQLSHARLLRTISPMYACINAEEFPTMTYPNRETENEKMVENIYLKQIKKERKDK